MCIFVSNLVFYGGEIYELKMVLFLLFRLFYELVIIFCGYVFCRFCFNCNFDYRLICFICRFFLKKVYFSYYRLGVIFLVCCVIRIFFFVLKRLCD